MSCEENCPYFGRLTVNEKIINRNARLAAGDGNEFPGLHNTMCGSCARMKKTEEDLNKRLELLKTLSTSCV